MTKMLEEGVLEEVLEMWEDKQKYIQAKLQYQSDLDSWKFNRIINGLKSFAFTAGSILLIWGTFEAVIVFMNWYNNQYTVEQQTTISVASIGVVLFVAVWFIIWSVLNQPKPTDFRTGDRALKTYLSGLKNDN